MIARSNPELIVRHGYFDESGIGGEAYTVEAGFLIHVDKQYRNLQKYILDMADDLVGKDRPMDFVFHGKELWSGGKFFPREEWGREKRWEILGHLADIPEKYNLPIIYATVERDQFPATQPETNKTRATAQRRRHALALLSVLGQTDKFMSERYPDEMAFVIVEDNNEHRSLLRDTANFLNNPRLAPAIEADPGIDWKPHRYIVDEPLFQKKSGHGLLQVADICAFIIGKFFCGDQRVRPYFEKLLPMMITGGKLTAFVRRKSASLQEQSS